MNKYSWITKMVGGFWVMVLLAAWILHWDNLSIIITLLVVSVFPTLWLLENINNEFDSLADSHNADLKELDKRTKEIDEKIEKLSRKFEELRK